MLLNCVLEKTLESPLDCMEIQPVIPKENQSWVFIGRIDVEAETLNTLATWCEELTHWKRPWCWEGLKAGGEGDNGGWDGWMASPTQQTWVWVGSESWWWTGRPGVLRFMGSQRVGHDWATELTEQGCGKWREMEHSPVTHGHLGACKSNLPENAVFLSIVFGESYKESFGSIWSTWKPGNMYNLLQCNHRWWGENWIWHTIKTSTNMKKTWHLISAIWLTYIILNMSLGRFFFFFRLCHTTCGTLVPLPGSNLDNGIESFEF